MADQLLGTMVAEVVPAEFAGMAGGLRNAEAQGTPDPYEVLRELQHVRRCPRCGHPIVLSIDAGRELQSLCNALFEHAAPIRSSLPPDDMAGRQRLAASCMVFPCLLASDSDWTDKTTETLPGWLRQEDWLAACERFALHAGRPRTAYFLGLAGGDKEMTGNGMVEFQRKAAGRMVRERDYIAQLACLRGALGQAQADQDAKAITAVASELAEAMSEYGHPAEGAELLQRVLHAASAPHEPGELRVLRMHCLYKAEEYELVAKEAGLFLREDRHPRRRPQLLYLAWTASRRLDRTPETDAYADDFLKSYPTHPLAADLLYASAMASLAQADYGSAKTILARVMHDFPDAPVCARADQLLQRLERLDGATADRKSPAQ